MQTIVLYETEAGEIECTDPKYEGGLTGINRMITRVIDDDKFELIMKGDLDLAKGLMRTEFNRIMNVGLARQ